MPRRRPRRPPTVVDAMILVAGVAVGLALNRDDPKLWDRLSSLPETWAYSWLWFLLAKSFALGLVPISLAYLVIRLRRPRPPLRRLILQPGTAACAAVVIVTALDVVAWSIYWRGDPARLTRIIHRYWNLYGDRPALAVAVTWLGLWLSRRWRPEPGWIDRLGQAIGMMWIVLLLQGQRFGRWTLNIVQRTGKYP